MEEVRYDLIQYERLESQKYINQENKMTLLMRWTPLTSSHKRLITLETVNRVMKKLQLPNEGPALYLYIQRGETVISSVINWYRSYLSKKTCPFIVNRIIDDKGIDSSGLANEISLYILSSVNR